MRAVPSVLLLVFSLAFASAAAQQTTGDIQGRIVGPTGQPLTDVRVSVTSGSLQGDRQTLSDARGRFVLPSLPAGSYAVAIRRIGYGVVRVQDVPVRLGSTTSLGRPAIRWVSSPSWKGKAAASKPNRVASPRTSPQGRSGN